VFLIHLGLKELITENLPSGLIAIEELTPEEEVVFLFWKINLLLNLREHESIFYSPPRSTTWYLSLTNYLDNSGISFSPPRTPYPSRGIYYSSKYV
jgi:hypothetical protein